MYFGEGEFLADIRERQDQEAEAIQLLETAFQVKGMAPRNRFPLGAKLPDFQDTELRNKKILN